MLTMKQVCGSASTVQVQFLKMDTDARSSSILLCSQVVVSSERGPLKDVLHNETVELETEMVVAIVKDVASALKYLHQLEPPILAKEITSSGVVLNADYGAQLIHMHLAMVRKFPSSDICIIICCCSMQNVMGWQCKSSCQHWSNAPECSSLTSLSKTLTGFCYTPYMLKKLHNPAAFIRLLQARGNHTYLFGLGW